MDVHLPELRLEAYTLEAVRLLLPATRFARTSSPSNWQMYARRGNRTNSLVDTDSLIQMANVTDESKVCGHELMTT